MAAPWRNPYLNRSMIRSVDEFYGRKRELQRILSRVGAPTPQSVSLVGERRMGKSSILWHLAQRQVHAGSLPEPERYLFLLLDFQGHQHLDQAGFCQVLTRHLVEAAGDRLRLGEAAGLDGLTAAAEALDAAGLRLVCLFDEFETVTRSAAFGPEFYGALRSLANAHSLAFVTASRRNLQSLCHSQQISESPFFNIFAEVRVGPMSAEETGQLIASPSAAAGLPLAPHAAVIRRLGGDLPFFVQIACAAAVDCLGETGALDPDRLEDTFLEEASSHFQYLWETFAETERAIVCAAAAGSPAGADDGPWARLLEAQGYLVRRDGRRELFSSAFARFVDRQQPPARVPPAPSAHTPGPAPLKARHRRNRYALAAVAAVALTAAALWITARPRGSDEAHSLQAAVLSPNRVSSVGLALEVQWEVRTPEGVQPPQRVYVDADHPTAAQDVVLRRGDRLRLFLAARDACQAYAYVIPPGTEPWRLPEGATRPLALEAGRVMVLPPGDRWLEVGPQSGRWSIVVVVGEGRQQVLDNLELSYIQASTEERPALAEQLVSEIRSLGAVDVDYVVAR